LRLAELYWVSTKILLSPELMQLEIGTSTSRYLPARGTAGLARSLVSGKSRVPAPPPMMTASISFIGARSEVWKAGTGACLRAGRVQRGKTQATPGRPRHRIAVDWNTSAT